MLINKITAYLSLMRLQKPIGIWLLLWPTLIALWLAAEGKPDVFTVSIFVAGVIIMRSAGCVINDYADRHIDPLVQRTKDRPLANSELKSPQALVLFGCLATLGLLLVLQLSMSTLFLSLIGLGLIIIYPFSKRVTFYPQFILGLAFGWGIPLAYMQIQQQLSIETWILYASVIAWVVAYDTQYALIDKTDDLNIGVKSTAIAFGKHVDQIIFLLQLGSLLGLSVIGLSKELNWPFFVGVILALGLVFYQQYLIKDQDPKLCLKAFKNNNYFGALIFFGLVLSI